MQLSERFRLKYKDKGFAVLPWDPSDAAVYFGSQALNTQLQRRIEAAYALAHPPKIYLQGRWGTGKTHHLYHLKYRLENNGAAGRNGFLVRFFAIECEDDTDFRYLHRKLLNSIGIDVVKSAVSNFLMQHGANRAHEQRRLFESTNLTVATQVLSIGDDQLAWKWLSGLQLNTGELRSLNVTANLEDTAELVDVLVRVGRLLREQGNDLVFLIDEAESLKNVNKPNAQRSWHDGLRNLADQANNSIGFVMAIHTDTNNSPPEFIMEDDINRRIGQQNILTLEPLADAPEVKGFLKDLLHARIDFASLPALPSNVTGETYPFEVDAFDLFLNELISGVSPTPSKVIESLSECALTSHLANEDFISMEVVQDVVPRVVSQA